MLLEALVACAGVTLRAVATSLAIAVDGGASAEGDLDFRGTLGVDRKRRSASARSACASSSTPMPTTEQLDTLLELTERYCVVLQSLTGSARLQVDWGR